MKKLCMVLVAVLLRFAVVEGAASTLYFPDYVVGSGWSVQLALGNVDITAAAEVVVEVYDQDGAPIRDLFDSGSAFEIPPLGSRVLRSAGEGSLRRGWIQVRNPSGLVRGLLTYRHAGTGIEVGVEPVPLGRRFALFVEDSADVGTGLAIFKPQPSSGIEFDIRDQAGRNPLEEVLTRGNFQQRVGTLPEWFEGAGGEFLGDFRGLLFLRAVDGASFAPMGLRGGKRTGSLSAVPVIPIPDPGGGKMYWTDRRAGKIQRANLDGSGVEDLVTTGLIAAGALALDPGGGKMYWTDWGSPRIRRANLDGSGVETLVRGLSGSGPFGLALDPGGGKMYWTNRVANTIQRANLDGSGVQDLVTKGLGSPVSLALDLSGGKMYWADLGANKIQRANLDGSGVEDLVTGLFFPYDLALDLGGGKMYWADGGSHKILRANLDGSGVEGLVTTEVTGPESLALDLDSGKMYWGDCGTEKIQRANLDGSGVEDLVTTEVRCTSGLALNVGNLHSVEGAASTLYFPDYVVGSGWSVQLALGNIDAAAAAEVVVEVYDQGGAPIRGLFDSGSAFEIPPLGSRVLRSDGEGSLRRGWIQVRNPSTTVRGLLTYRHSETGVEVGVEPVPLGKRFALFVEDSADVGTGLAIFKSQRDTGIEFDIRDQAGRNPLEEVLTRGDFQQQAGTLPEWFEGAGGEFLGDFRGLLFLRAVDGASFAPLGLRGVRRTGSLSAVPVIPLPEPGVPNLGAGKMYWVDGGTKKIQRANLDGSGVEDLVKGLVSPADLVMDPYVGKMYWADGGTNKIQRANLDGSGVEDLVTELIAPKGLTLVLDVGKMYWTDWLTGKVQRANLDGSGVEDLVTGLRTPFDLALDLDDGRMYWTDLGTYKVQRANLDGSGLQDLVTGLRTPAGLTLDLGADKMYWTDSETDKVQRANLDGSGLQDLVTGLNSPYVLALAPSAGKMYWTDLGTGKIQRANLDGSVAEDLVTGLSTPFDLELALSVGKMYWTDTGTEKIQRANLDGSRVEDLVTTGLISPISLVLDVAPVRPRPTVTMSASPGSIEPGQSSTLTWSSTNAQSASITPRIGSVPTSGTRRVFPAQTTTYRITGPKCRRTDRYGHGAGHRHCWSEACGPGGHRGKYKAHDHVQRFLWSGRDQGLRSAVTDEEDSSGTMDASLRACHQPDVCSAGGHGVHHHRRLQAENGLRSALPSQELVSLRQRLAGGMVRDRGGHDRRCGQASGPDGKLRHRGQHGPQCPVPRLLWSGRDQGLRWAGSDEDSSGIVDGRLRNDHQRVIQRAVGRHRFCDPPGLQSGNGLRNTIPPQEFVSLRQRLAGGMVRHRGGHARIIERIGAGIDM